MRQKLIQKTRRRKKRNTLPTPTETVFSDGSEHFRTLLQDLQQATVSIDLETYIFQNDHLGKLVAETLAEAAARGVTVRVLVDGAGTPYWSMHLAKTIEKAGAETRVYHPFPWQLWNWSRSVVKLPTVLKWIYLLLKFNRRNHRKVCVIDERIAYIGSMNISKDHLTQESGGNAWRDTSVRITDTDLSMLSKAFEEAWTHRGIQERLTDIFRHFRRDPIIRLNHTWLRRRVLYKNLLRKIRQSRRRVWITNAYFVPDTVLQRKLKDAAKRGIDVRILLPSKSDVMMMPWASSTFYYSLLKSGIRIFEYLPSNLHAKTLIIDRWITVGSSNLNHRSLLHDLEVDVNIRSPRARKALAEQFLTDIREAREISLSALEVHRPWYQRFLGRLLLYMKYWI